MVEAFTQSKAKIEAYKGGIYSILNGQISGEFMEVDRPNRIMLRWRQSTWPEGKVIEISTISPLGVHTLLKIAVKIFQNTIKQ